MSTPARMSLKELFRACEEGDVASVRRVVENGVNVKDAVNKEYMNYTPLHYACWYEIIIIIMIVPVYCVHTYILYSSKIS